MGPGDLRTVLAPLALREDPNILVGRESFDDAGVFRVSSEMALVQTVDFFAPIVDNPYDFGQIAAANALSDVYAMGGEPMTALAIAGFPTGLLPLTVLTDILRGAQDTVHAAGAVLIGGHTVVDNEVKFGLSVTGRVHPDRILTNRAARPGDRLVLTKPLGSGLVATAVKQEKASVAHADEMVDVMRRLNRDAARAAVSLGVRCATDVTGFGLLGHARHVASASHVTVVIRPDQLPMLGGVAPALAAGISTGGSERNLADAETFTQWNSASAAARQLLTDPQTSGGLLVSCPPDVLVDYLARVPGAREIGEVVARREHLIVLE